MGSGWSDLPPAVFKVGFFIFSLVITLSDLFSWKFGLFLSVGCFLDGGVELWGCFGRFFGCWVVWLAGFGCRMAGIGCNSFWCPVKKEGWCGNTAPLNNQISNEKL
jgi:hypothetical protein